MTPLSASEFAREARRAAQAQTGLIDAPAPTAPALPPERKRTPAPPKPPPAEEERPKYTPPPSAFPHPVPTVPVNLPDGGTPEEIRAYFNRQYGMTRVNSTADRARRLAAKLAKASAYNVPLPPYDWQSEQATWRAIRIEEEAARE